MVRSRVGIGGVERPDKVGIFDRKSEVEKRERILKQQARCAGSERRALGRMLRKKKKGETAV
jgi:hypothetical protein